MSMTFSESGVANAAPADDARLAVIRQIVDALEKKGFAATHHQEMVIVAPNKTPVLLLDAGSLMNTPWFRAENPSQVIEAALYMADGFQVGRANV
jgi:hypothetical protein